MPSKFVKSATKKSILALVKQGALTARGWARLLEAVVFKSELDSFVSTTADEIRSSTSRDLGAYVRRDGTKALTADWDAGSYEIRAKTLESDATTGTAPLTVASTTKVTNLNADRVDNVEEAKFAYIDGTRDFTGNVTVATGDMYLDDASDPALYLREGGDVSNYGRIYDTGPTLNIRHIDAGASTILFDPIASDNTSQAEFRFFRNTNTSGNVLATFYVGDGTSTIQHAIQSSSGDLNFCQQSGQATIGGSGGAEKLTVVGDASFGDGGTTDYVTVDSNKLLSFQGSADIAAAVNTPVVLDTFVDVKQRNAEYHIHGGLDSLDTGSALNSVPADIVVTVGTGKIMVVVNAGSDLVGDITVTGTSVDRDSGAEAGAATDTLTVDALTTDNSDTDASGNVRHSFTGAYITSKWFKGSVTLSTTNLTLTDVDTYQVSFEQLNDNPGIVLQTFDLNALATNSSAWMYAYLYSLQVTGDKCNIARESTLDLPAAEVSANKFYRLRRGGLAVSLDGTTDGIWIDMFPGPLASTYWENINIKVWSMIKSDVYGEAS